MSSQSCESRNGAVIAASRARRHCQRRGAWTRLISDRAFVNFSAMNLRKRKQNILEKSNLPLTLATCNVVFPKYVPRNNPNGSRLLLTFAERCTTFVQPARHGKFLRLAVRAVTWSILTAGQYPAVRIDQVTALCV